MSQDLTPKDLGKRTREIAEFYFANPSMSRKEIAKALSIHETRISQVLNHPKVRAVYRVLARNRMQDMVPQAVKAYEQLIENSSNDAVREKAASKILSNEKVFDNPTLNIHGEIRITDVRVLQEKVKQAAELLNQDAIDAEIVDDTTSPTPQIEPPKP